MLNRNNEHQAQKKWIISMISRNFLLMDWKQKYDLGSPNLTPKGDGSWVLASGSTFKSGNILISLQGARPSACGDD